MTLDEGNHKVIRDRILQELHGVKRLYSSHEGKGNIAFYWKFNGNRIRLAEPDIVIETDNHVLVVEIELGNSPKRLMGVACAIYLSNCGKYAKKTKKESQKPMQIKEIKSLIEKELKFDYFNIVKDDRASDEILKWLKDKLGE